MTIPKAKINILDVIKESWMLIPGTKWPIFKRFLLAGLFSSIFVMIHTFFSLSISNESLSVDTSHRFYFLLDFAVMIIMPYISIQISIPAFMVSTRRSLGLPLDSKAIKTECKNAQNKLNVL